MTAISIAQPDVTLRLDPDGVIREASVAASLNEKGIETWVGRPWVDTVGEPGSDKIRRLVADARERSVSGFRQINQRFPSGRELLIEYTAVRLGDPPGFIAIGRSLQAVTEMQSRLVAAQHEMEREYWKLRELETRYRLLFDSSTEAVMLVQAAHLRLVEANRAALRALGLAPYPPGVIAGQDFLPTLLEEDRTALQAMLERVRVDRRAPGMLVRLGKERTPWMVRASLTQSDTGLMFLLQFTPAATALPGFGEPDLVPTDALIERLPDGFVVCDRSGTIVHGNRAFLDLIEVAGNKAAVGEPLSRWVGSAGAEVTHLLAEVAAHGAVRGFRTHLRSEGGAVCAVEACAASDARYEARYVGALIRKVVAGPGLAESGIDLSAGGTLRA
jgi:transcriptional regulator PpsR